MSPSRHFLFLLASTRAGGNAETLARAASAALPPAVQQTWLRLDEHPLPPFVDRRHESAAAWAPDVEGESRFLLEATLAATDVVFVAPVYWYSLPASAKLYLDHWTAWLRAPGWDFKSRMSGRTLWAVTALSDSDSRLADPLRDTLRLTADYMHMRWGGILIGEGNRPGDVHTDSRALTAAKAFFAS